MGPAEATSSLARLVDGSMQRVISPLFAFGALAVLLTSVVAGQVLDARLLAQARARAETTVGQLAATAPGLSAVDGAIEIALLDDAGVRVLEATDPALHDAASPALAAAARDGFDGRFWSTRGQFHTARGAIAHYWLRLDLVDELRNVAVLQLVVTLGGIVFVAGAVGLVRQRLRRDLLPRLSTLAETLLGPGGSTPGGAGDGFDALIGAAGELQAAIADGRRREAQLQEDVRRLAAATASGGVMLRECDATDEKPALAALARARDEALRATQAKSRFLANMSHELRTPLNGVLGMLSLLERERLSDEQREFVDVAVKSGRTLFELIDDVLDFSKIEAGALTLERTPCLLRSVAEDVLDMLAERACQRGIDLVLRWDADLPRRVETDPARLRQVLLNLLGNAVEFTAHGHVMLALAPAAAGGRIRFEVRDTGIGIPRERQQAIFEPFAQADESTTRRFGGTGLGLGITRQLVDLMGGQLELDSAPGRGTGFVFELPLADLGVEPAAGPPALAGRRILFQEPVAVVAEAGAALLRAHGARVDLVRDAAGASAALAAPDAHFDLLMVAASDDLHGSGEAVARLRDGRRGAAVPVIATLPFGRRTGSAERRLLGVRGLLTKPLREAHVLRVIDEALAPAATVPASARAPTPAPAAGVERAALAVLVVDDVVTNLKVAAGMLARLGIKARLAESGRAALDAVASTEFDLIFMDCQMPGMDGFETTALIRARYLEGEGPRIIAMTANAARTDRERCLAHGMDDYLAKPVLLSDLERVLQRWAGTVDTRPSAPDLRKPLPDRGSVVDRHTFDGLATLLGAEEFSAVCARFRHDGRLQLDRFGVALSAGDPAGSRRAAHALKGAAANIGALKLASLCHAADEARDHELSPMLAALEAAYDEFCATQGSCDAVPA